MDIHVCKQCGSQFSYCRKCVFRPIRFKDAGFCSKECYEASKNMAVKPEIIEEPIMADEVVAPIEEETPVEVKVEEVISDEAPIIEAITVVEPTIKKETNTYKKKKNKYQVHE